MNNKSIYTIYETYASPNEKYLKRLIEIFDDKKFAEIVLEALNISRDHIIGNSSRNYIIKEHIRVRSKLSSYSQWKLTAMTRP